MSTRNLEFLLAPNSVALIGASPSPGSLGAIVLHRLSSSGFRGDLHLVNPKYRNIGDAECFASVAALPSPPDLGVVVAPAAAVPGIIAELGEAGARAAVVITAGLDSGQRQAMLDSASRYCLRILGPNCIGLQVPSIGLDASFAHLTARPGRLALLSQSGAIVAAMLDWAEARGIGFSMVASLGDMADVDVGDLLDHLAGDPGTSAILMYLEQITQARKFMSNARSTARSKPVIVVKAGRSVDAARAAASHTGALAGQDAVYDAAFQRAGILRVADLNELFDAAEALARHKPLQDDRLAILTNGGGAGVLAADALASVGLRVPALAPETIENLNGFLPPTWSKANPVDIIGDAGPERYSNALAALLADKRTDAVLVMNCPTGLSSSREAAEAVVACHAELPVLPGRRPKPLLAAWLGEATAREGAQVLQQAGIPVYQTPDEAVHGFSYLVRHRQAQQLLTRAPPSIPGDFTPDRATARAVLDGAIKAGRRLLTEPEAKTILRAYGIPTVETGTADTAEEAAALAASMLQGCREVVIKILSREISHKSDVGGVRLNLATPDEVRAAAESMLAQVAARMPDAHIDGIVVQPMIHRPGAHELILGISDDAVFGPVMLFGAGGTSVEVVADKALALPPIDTVLAEDMIGRTRIARLLEGYRNRPAADLKAIGLALVRLSQLAADMPEIRELDINPLLADENGVIALDARVVAEPCAEGVAAPGGNPRFAIRPYPSQWDSNAPLRDGAIRIRPIRPEDEALYPAFIEKLTSEDINFRFFAAFWRPGHEQIARFTQIDYARAMAFVALEAGTGDLLGVSRLSADSDYRTAEFAILVRSDRHGRGIGAALMVRLIDYARAEGIGELFGDVLAANANMLRMCRKLGFAITAQDDDAALMRVRLTLTPA